jgi:hypothetical protein
MSVSEIAKGLVSLCRAGKFDEAMNAYYAPDIISIEAMPGEGQEVRGLEACKAKGEEWMANHEVHGLTVSDPFLNGDQFAVHFAMDITPKHTGKRETFEEIALYRVAGGKIVHEQFFYGTE